MLSTVWDQVASSARVEPAAWLWHGRGVPDDLPRRTFRSGQEWDEWLADQPASTPGVWLVIAKKGSGEDSLSYAEALEVALCHGWIDGRKAPLDDRWWLQRFTPRRSRSPWSEANRRAAEKLIAAGRMRPAGLAEVERARADGRWESAYAGQRTIQVPADLQAALDNDAEAAAFFAALNSANRYAILYRLQEAKRPETRARRLEQFVTMLREGRTLHPQPQRSGPRKQRNGSRSGEVDQRFS
jgi:uncharacterized protein YdeI (YjbR/CyaY-like superfamily)